MGLNLGRSFFQMTRPFILRINLTLGTFVNAPDRRFQYLYFFFDSVQAGFDPIETGFDAFKALIHSISQRLKTTIDDYRQFFSVDILP